MFSGQPNPSFTLDPAYAEEFARQLAVLSEAPPGVTPCGDGLGYRGLRVEGPAGATICAGLVEIRDGRGSRYLADPNRNVERWLIEAAAGQLPRGILEVLRQELERH